MRYPFRKLVIQKSPSVVADQLDQRRHTQRSPDVVDVQHQHGDADQHEHVRNADRDSGHLSLALELHLTHRQHGVGERGDEQPDRQLTWPIPKERLHDPWRKLAHR